MICLAIALGMRVRNHDDADDVTQADPYSYH